MEWLGAGASNRRPVKSFWNSGTQLRVCFPARRAGISSVAGLGLAATGGPPLTQAWSLPWLDGKQMSLRLGLLGSDRAWKPAAPEPSGAKDPEPKPRRI